MKAKSIIITAMLLAMLCVLAPEQASAQRPRPHGKSSVIKTMGHRSYHKPKKKQQGTKTQPQRVNWQVRPAVYTRDTLLVTTTHRLKKRGTGLRSNLNSTAINHANQAFQFYSSPYDPLTFSQTIWYNTILPILGVESSDICVEINDIYIYMADNCLCFDIVAPQDSLPQIIGMKLKNIRGIHELINVLQVYRLSTKIKVNDYAPITLTSPELLALVFGNTDINPWSILGLKMVYGDKWRDAYTRLDALFSSNPMARQ